MKNLGRSLQWACLLIVCAAPLNLLAQRTTSMVGINIIEGRITGPTNVGVNNVFVELYNNFGA